MKLALTALLIFCLAIGGCVKSPPMPPTPPAPSDPLTALEALVAASEVTVATLSATGTIPANIALGIENAIAPLPSIYSQTAVELASSDSAAAKALKIQALYAPILVSLGALPPTAQIWVTAISAGIRAFLAFYPTQGLTASGSAARVDLDPTRMSTLMLRAGRMDEQLKALAGR